MSKNTNNNKGRRGEDQMPSNTQRSFNDGFSGISHPARPFPRPRPRPRPPNSVRHPPNPNAEFREAQRPRPEPRRDVPSRGSERSGASIGWNRSDVGSNRSPPWASASRFPSRTFYQARVNRSPVPSSSARNDFQIRHGAIHGPHVSFDNNSLVSNTGPMHYLGGNNRFYQRDGEDNGHDSSLASAQQPAAESAHAGTVPTSDRRAPTGPRRSSGQYRRTSLSPRLSSGQADKDANWRHRSPSPPRPAAPDANLSEANKVVPPSKNSEKVIEITSSSSSEEDAGNASTASKKSNIISEEGTAHNPKSNPLKRIRSDESLKSALHKPSGAGSQKRARARGNRSPPKPVLSDDSMLPTMSEVLQSRARPTESSDFIDNEAMDDDQSSSNDDHESNINAYDCNDSFIDDGSVYDSDVKPVSPLAQARLQSPFASPITKAKNLSRVRRSRAHSPDNDSGAEIDIDGNFPGVVEEDPVVTAYKARYRRRKTHDDDMYRLSVGYENNRSFTLARLEELQDNGVASDGSIDDDRQLELARRESLLSAYSPWKTRQEYERQVARERGLLLDRPSSSHVRSKKTDKGKGKAHDGFKSPLPLAGPDDRLPDDEDNSEDGLSEYERNMRYVGYFIATVSHRHSLRVGETSRQGSSRHAGLSEPSSHVDASAPPISPLTPSSHQTGTTPPGLMIGSPVTPASTAPGSTPSTSSNALLTPSSAGGMPNQNDSPQMPSGSSSSSAGNTFRTAQHVTALPDACEVNDPLLHDPALASDYSSLPPLRHCELVPWADLPGPGQVQWSEWENQCQRMNNRLALGFMRFVSNGYFVNPSRASPVAIDIRELNSGSSNTRYHAYVGQSPLVALSPVFLEHSQLTEPSATGLHQRFLRGIFHAQEWERAVAYLNMIFGCRRMHAQLARDALQFSTRGTFKSKTDNGSSGSAFRKTSSKMFTKNVSRSTVSSFHQNKVSADTFSLPNDANIPVFDGRDASGFSVPSDLTRLSERLPVWHGEIPFGSLVVVAYTVASFRSREGNWTLGCNIQWAIVLGTPDETE
ncbi:hypothetical protein EST38_g9065 [Candolleomyces aberdarensis]|uniref:Uncharacterized protein n=1 Tax=Candolleomyces aberdarensis TaxID=2316362 RepID=A0A4Q2DCP1_9AGAR|nr:hypothetical protein EST38_g9065 [Candolleomyces aberdarensis]